MKNHKLFFGMVAVFSLVLGACGRDTLTVEESIEGRWTLTDARVNDEPLVEVIEQYEDFLTVDPEAVTGLQEGQTELEADFYYNEGLLTLVNADGEQTTLPYETVNSDEKHDVLTLEFSVQEEDLDLTLHQVITFVGDEREALTSELNVMDIQVNNTTGAEGTTELEEASNQLLLEMLMGVVRNLNIDLDMAFVEEAEAPDAE